MISKVILSASGILLFVVGAIVNFMPQETAGLFGLAVTSGTTQLIQLLSAAWLGVGLLDWFSRENRVGGIYSRPLALANFMLFGVSSASLDRAALKGGALPMVVAAIVATVFALAYAWLIFFNDPVAKEEKRRKSA